jgi:hypothetical protein
MMSEDTDRPKGAERPPVENLDDVLASIRSLVSAEAASRMKAADPDSVLLLTPQMRVDVEAEDREHPGTAILAEGLGGGSPAASAAPILDEEGLRRLVNRIVREELQGELGERISRNLRKLIRREIAQIEAERRGGSD